MKLSATQIKQAKPDAKAYKLFDGGGLFLLVNPNGSKYWRMRYRFAGRDKTVAFGTYPDLSLKNARIRRATAREQLADGRDPGMIKQAVKQAAAGTDSFEAIAREWHAKNVARWSKGHAHNILHRLEVNVFPWLGRRKADEISAPELLKVLQRIEHRGAVETAHRVKQYCGTIFRYAIATGRAERDPAADLRGALAQPNFRHLPGITEPAKVGGVITESGV